MSSKAIFGSVNGSSLVLYKGYPKATREGYAWVVTYKYWCQLVLAETLIPAAYAACPHPNHTTLKLRETSIEENGAAGMCDVTLVYKLAGSAGTSSHENGEVVKSSQVGWMEIPLEDDRLVSSGLLTANQVADKRKDGYLTHGVGTIEYSYTEYLDAFTWSESNLVTGVGDTSDPEGMTSPTSGKWMLAGLTIRSDGDLVEKVRTWRYNKLGWKP